MIIGTVSLAGKRGRLALGFLHAHLAVFRGGDAQRRAQGGTVFFRLVEGGGDRLDAGMAAALGQIVEGRAAVGQIAEFGGGQRQFLGQFGRLGADFARPRG